MVRFLITVFIAVGMAVLPRGPLAGGAASSECVQVTLQAASADCAWTYVGYGTARNSGDGHTWAVTIKFANGGTGKDPIPCRENDEDGFMHDVFRDGVDVGDVCVPSSAIPDGPDIDRLAAEAFKKLDWPQSELSVQPPGGKTLVNLPTIFFTSNDHATTRTVTLVGREVTVEAWPESYSWHFGDAESLTTKSPGHAHPEEDVTHTYARKGEVSVRVDTTYRGRWRLGSGAWTEIAETLTVVGESQDLAILEARPELVVE